jgi:hypothetical protein
MPNWIISCHGFSDKKSGNKLALTKRQKYQNGCIPFGLELVTYTKQGVNLSMDDGWDLWEMLTGNQEAQAYARKHKGKKWPTSIINYGLSGPHHASDYQDWLAPGDGECACGLFHVGNRHAFQAFPIATEVTTLQDVLNRAKAAKVARVYYLACQELA